MELDAECWELPVSDSHDFTVVVVVVGPRGQFEFVTERRFRHDKAVVPCRLERLAEPLEQARVIVMNHGRLAVHQPVGTDDLSAVDFGDALVAQAHSQQRAHWTEVLNDGFRQAGFAGCAGPGRHDNAFRLQRFDAGDADLVVPFNADFKRTVDLTESLDQVEREGVIVVQHENHRRSLAAPRAGRQDSRRAVR